MERTWTSEILKILGISVDMDILTKLSLCTSNGLKELVSLNDLEKTKQQYVYSTIMNRYCSTYGDSKTANKHARILSRIMQKVRNGETDKSMLLDLLDHENISVSALAAIDLLRINHQVEKAEKVLKRIAMIDETGRETHEKLTIMAAGIQLKSWKERHFVT